MALVIESSCCGRQTIDSRVGQRCPSCGGIIERENGRPRYWSGKGNLFREGE